MLRCLVPSGIASSIGCAWAALVSRSPTIITRDDPFLIGGAPATGRNIAVTAALGEIIIHHHDQLLIMAEF
jgi:hypothetical protein